ncbi:MAG: ribose 5-phosphate isomerase B [Chloroflexi bacterium]|jgi:ribose 5-phosphate isomerase B|nr:ribose 5-phosphate isomerase B [Chloroflexota bacterium]
MKIAIGCDKNAIDLKNSIVHFLESRENVTVADMGIYLHEEIDYPDIAYRVCQSIQKGDNERGILICGTGIGMAIAANKMHGIRAACCHDVYSAERARKSNNAQVITLGAQVIGIELAKVIINEWLRSEFAGGRSFPKVKRIIEIEESERCSKTEL